ncbi:hypothetical protein [Arenimonas sp.]|uniref:hypothetical protein n=1 Tax=Arenimonas sp. TaxID=1872635 RepID=UPI0039E5B6F3
MFIGRIKPVTEYEQVCADLHQAFLRRGAPEESVRLVGLLFARQASPLAQKEIIPNLAYFNARSGDNVNFYCGGYWAGDLPPDPHTGRVQVGNGWVYSDERFDEFRKQVEQRSAWRYSGGADLILLNARFQRLSLLRQMMNSGEATEVVLDFSSAIVLPLEALRHQNIIPGVEQFFESIFRYAEEQDGCDPTWGFSQKVAGSHAGSYLLELILSLLPAQLGKSAKELAHFAVRDISARP